MEIAIENRFQLIDVNTSFSWTICIIDLSFGGADDAYRGLKIAESKISDCSPVL